MSVSTLITPTDLTRCLIGGQWLPAASGKVFPVSNPATGEILCEVPDCDDKDAESAVKAADQAFKEWRAETAKHRSKCLMQWNQLILEHQEELATLMTLECGKPIAESRGEVVYAASFVEWFAEEAKRVRGDTIPHPSNDRRILVQKQPVGACSAITPWNFPLAMITRKCAPAIAAGCSVVVKPAESTPLSALALGKLSELAGIPPGVFNVVTAKTGEKVGNVLTTHPLIKKISFTGSTAVGKQLLAQAAGTVKRVSMELGGNAPFIVFDDADIEKAVEKAIASKYRNTGQTCVCANRFLVQKNVVKPFSELLAKRSAELQVGNGLDPLTVQGPLINEPALNKVKELLADAINKGAELLTGGSGHTKGGLFFQPTVITGVSQTMRLAHEEIFGPIAAIHEFESEADAIQLANDTPYGLAAYFFTENYSRVFRVSEALEYGMVGVNEGVLSSEMAPFGGMKESGLGREGSHLGIEEYLETKYVCLGGLE
jgi:succinate-semialdehyde dehydrogenase/glutarate-semialdehyde dehydrogenase